MDEMDSREELGGKTMAYAMAMPSFEDYVQLKGQNRSLRKLIDELKVCSCDSFNNENLIG